MRHTNETRIADALVVDGEQLIKQVLGNSDVNVTNAILHKDYSSGTPVQISVYADKLMLWNPGELPQDWTVARLKAKHPSHPFNPGVANVFFRAGQIEAWGRGIERIFSACTAAGTPPPALR